MYQSNFSYALKSALRLQEYELDLDPKYTFIIYFILGKFIQL